MGSLLFDFLTESLLFKPDLIDEQFAGIDDKDLSAELQRYREYCLSHREDLVAEAVGTRTGFRVFPGLDDVPLRHLKQTSLYVERYVLADPLFPFTEHETETARVMRSYLGHSNPHGINKAELAETLRRLRELTPMVAANYVKWLPLTYLFEPPTELPIYYSKTQFADELPTDMSKFFQNGAVVENLRRDKTDWVWDHTLATSRGIAVSFRGDSRPGMMFQLFEQEITNFDESTGKFTARISLPDALPDQAYYDHWVEQSLNRTAINFTDRLFRELSLSTTLGTSYMCSSDFRNDFLTRFFPTATTPSEHTANVLMQLELPFMDEIDTSTLMAVRRDDGEAFQQFRHFLEQQFWDLRTEPDPIKARSKADKAVHELATVQQELLSAKLKQLRRGALAQATVLSATLTGTFLSGSTYWPALIVAGAGAYRLATEYRTALRQTPAFFLWKVRG
jgi:hypothetical protein